MLLGRVTAADVAIYTFMLLSVELDPNWTECTNKFGKLDIPANLKNIGKIL